MIPIIQVLNRYTPSTVGISTIQDAVNWRSSCTRIYQRKVNEQQRLMRQLYWAQQTARFHGSSRFGGKILFLTTYKAQFQLFFSFLQRSSWRDFKETTFEGLKQEAQQNTQNVRHPMHFLERIANLSGESPEQIYKIVRIYTRRGQSPQMPVLLTISGTAAEICRLQIQILQLEVETKQLTFLNLSKLVRKTGREYFRKKNLLLAEHPQLRRAFD